MLAVEKITKRFPGVIALEDVCLELHAGKVNAIIGENGAGKSTLMKILSGVYSDYEGEIVYNGKSIRFDSPRDAQEKGIAIIHQELNLVPYLSIRENIFLGREIINSWGLIDSRTMREQTISLLTRLKLDLDPDTLLYTLKVGQQQVVEIAKALLVESEVIIMDEPTSAISESEVEVLFQIIAGLKKENKIIVYISHKLDELFKIADRYIVLRDGKSIEQGNLAGMSQDTLIQKMVGRKVNIMTKDPLSLRSQELLRVENVSLAYRLKPKENFLKNISFTLNKGEVLGIFGLMGAGRTELLETIFGLYPVLGNCKVVIDQRPIVCSCPSDAINAGLALVPEDRKKDGLVLGLNVRNNISLTTLDMIEELLMIKSKKETALAKKYIGELSIKTSSEKQLAINLSGGNQQKIVLAKWLATKPKVLMLDEPTRGIDINAKNEIYKLIVKLAEEGLGIIMVSSELPEILAISDRVLVLTEGRITAEFPIAEATEDKILKAAIPK